MNADGGGVGARKGELPTTGTPSVGRRFGQEVDRLLRPIVLPPLTAIRRFSSTPSRSRLSPLRRPGSLSPSMYPRSSAFIPAQSVWQRPASLQGKIPVFVGEIDRPLSIVGMAHKWWLCPCIHRICCALLLAAPPGTTPSRAAWREMRGKKLMSPLTFARC